MRLTDALSSRIDCTRNRGLSVLDFCYCYFTVVSNEIEIGALCLLIVVLMSVFFLLGLQSWVAAFTETFLTWGILGACTMQITSHNRPKHLLHRDASLVVILTIAVLILAAFLANTCVQLLEARGFVYLPSSFGMRILIFLMLLK